MALTWGDLNGKVQDKIIPTVADVVYKSSPVFIRIRTQNGQQFDGGIKIRQNIGYAELNGAPFGRGGTFGLNGLGLTARQRAASKFSLIDSNAEMPTRPKVGYDHGERLSERTSTMDDATVRAYGNRNRKRSAEMPDPLPVAA